MADKTDKLQGSAGESLAKEIFGLIQPEIKKLIEEYIKDLREQFLREINELIEKKLSEILSEIEFYKKERQYLAARYGRVRTLEETLSARNNAAIFDEEGPIPPWKKL